LDPRGRVLAVAPHRAHEHASAPSSLNVCSKALSPSTRPLTHSHTGWLVLAAQKVAPSVQQIEDAKRDKLVQADIEGQ